MASRLSEEPIVFLGSGPVAAASLRLLAEHFIIEAVVTKPQPEHHKATFPVLAAATELGLPVRTTSNKAELSELMAAKPFTSRLGVVIDYGIIIAQDVIDYFPMGIVNSHFSLLPEWRGADPITFSILSGQERTGISLMLIVAALDEGPLLKQVPYTLPHGITTPELTDQLVKLSDQALADTLPGYLTGDITPQPQLEASILDDKTPTYSRKLSKQDAVLDYNKTALELEREVRAFAGWPRSRTRIADIDVVITAAHVEDGEGAQGALWLGDKNFGMYCQTGVLVFDRLIPAGKKEMDAAAFLAGYRPSQDLT
ncbi:MAG: fmt, methionyl-tRNA formyltransferase [Candidatus Saccharibacteria bacterium]|nr:fmt, methionyl-tRNA formyltransferase [Candidatus Saccharibacteria bacterium]